MGDGLDSQSIGEESLFACTRVRALNLFCLSVRLDLPFSPCSLSAISCSPRTAPHCLSCEVRGLTSLTQRRAEKRERFKRKTSACESGVRNPRRRIRMSRGTRSCLPIECIACPDVHGREAGASDRRPSVGHDYESDSGSGAGPTFSLPSDETTHRLTVSHTGISSPTPHTLTQ